MPTIITAGNAAARGYGFAGAAAVVPGLFTFTNFSAVNGSGTVNYLCGISYNPYYGRWVIGGRSSGNLPSWAGSADGVTWTTPATVGSVQLPNMTGVSQNSSTTTNYMAVFGATATGTGEYIYTSNGGTSFVASSSIISNAFLVTPTVATNSASGSGFVGRGSSNGLPYFVQSGFSGTAGSWAAVDAAEGGRGPR